MSGAGAFLSVLMALLLLALALRTAERPLFPLQRHAATDTTLGVAGEGAHGLRLAGTALVDLGATFALAAVYAAISRGSTVAWLILLLLVGEAMHWAFGVPTATYTWLFGTPA